MDDKPAAASALNLIIKTLSQLDPETRKRVFRSVGMFFQDETVVSSNDVAPQSTVGKSGAPTFSTENIPSPKQFLLNKQPRTDVERIACLAFYLTHYRDLPHFKTLDLAKLNTEAAQPKFSNTAYAATNAAKLGYLASATKTQRQISAAGEQFVSALPDREAAKLAMANARARRTSRRKKTK
jgi:hypothetical protein